MPPKNAKEAKASLKRISDEIAETVSSVESSRFARQVERITEELVEADRAAVLKTLKTVFAAFKSCANKKHPEIEEARKLVEKWKDDDAEAQQDIRLTVASKLTKACRDITQNTANIKKALEYETEITGLDDDDKRTIPTITTLLLPIANTKGSLTADMDKEQLKKMIKTVYWQANLFDDIAQRIP